MSKLNKVFTIILLSQIIFLFFSASFAFAQTPPKTYTPLVQIPNLTDKDSQQSTSPLSNYLSNIYTFGVGVAGVLAVIMIMWGGIEYMSTDSMGGKEGGKEKITNAIFGLLLALGSYLILTTINRQLVSTQLNIKSVTPNENSTFIPYAPFDQNGSWADQLWNTPQSEYITPTGEQYIDSALNYNSPIPPDASPFFTINPSYIAVDTDGSGIPPYTDPTRQSQTSYIKPDGTYLNANTDVYFVVPIGSNIPLGPDTLVQAYNRTQNRTVIGIPGDRGKAFGEMSLAAAMALGVSDGTSDSARQDDIVFTFYKAP